MKADSSWLYIILSIVFVALSAFGNKDKKKVTTSTKPLNDDYEPPTPPVSERKWPKSLEDVLTEVLDLPKQPEVVKEQPQPWNRDIILEDPRNSYEKIEEEAESLETIPDEIFTYETPVEFKPEKVKPAEVHDTPVKIQEAEPVFAFSNFDLKQGIIYAEILNRKYF